MTIETLHSRNAQKDPSPGRGLSASNDLVTILPSLDEAQDSSEDAPDIGLNTNSVPGPPSNQCLAQTQLDCH